MRPAGFTLVELLVVISIMAIVAVAVFLNLGSFEEDANLKNEAFNIQSYLRLAQSNATAGVKCADGTAGVGWSMIISGKDVDAIHLRCGTNMEDERFWSINLPAYIYLIQRKSGSTTCLSSFNPDRSDNSIIIKFSYLDGKIEFKDTDNTNNCLENSSNMIITLRKKVGSGDSKTVTINRGGSIDVE